MATDFQNGEQVELSKGRILDAVRASIAIPMIFPPWQVGDRWLVDGAVSDPLPIDVTIKEKGEPIVAIIPEFEGEIWSFDGKMIPYVIEEGVRAAERQLPYIRRLLMDD